MLVKFFAVLKLFYLAFTSYLIEYFCNFNLLINLAIKLHAMNKLLKQSQNAAKALEVRMEQESLEKYYVILAGMTIHYNRTCTNGTCEGNFMFVENMAYKVNSFTSLDDACKIYNEIKEEFID
jgi:hypothetical protein